MKRIVFVLIFLSLPFLTASLATDSGSLVKVAGTSSTPLNGDGLGLLLALCCAVLLFSNTHSSISRLLDHTVNRSPG